MKYCSKCGNQIMDEAVICVHCGCQVDSIVQSNSYRHTNELAKVQEYQSKVNTMHTLSIFALVLCLGIGFIFTIIGLAYASINKLGIPPKLENPSKADEAALNAVIKKKNRAALFLAIPGFVLVIAGVVFAIVMMI